jgi:Regulator of chromosome condensation (RCC1) repeat
MAIRTSLCALRSIPAGTRSPGHKGLCKEVVPGSVRAARRLLAGAEDSSPLNADAGQAASCLTLLGGCARDSSIMPQCADPGRTAIGGPILSFSRDGNRLSIGRRQGSTGLPLPIDGTLDGNKAFAGQFVHVAAGGHSLAVDRLGHLWTWGRNDSAGGGAFGSEPISDAGQLGHRSKMDGRQPAAVHTSTDFVAVAAGRYHSAAIDEQGNLLTWGLNDFGQLGREGQDALTGELCNSGSKCRHGVPTVIQAHDTKGQEFVAVAAGRYHTIALSREGRVYTAGLNFCGNAEV